MLARETGWTLHYIDNELDFTEVEEVLTIYDAVDRAHAYLREREASKAQRGRSGRRR